MKIGSLFKFYPIRQTYFKLRRTRKKLFPFALLMLVFATMIIAYSMFFAPKAQATWWDGNWQYRKTINLTYSGSTLTNTTVLVIKDFDVSADISQGKMQSNLADLRITDTSNNPLQYWIEDSTTSNIRVWAKVASIATGTTSLYMYYGNPSATDGQTAASSLFTIADNFNTNPNTNGNWIVSRDSTNDPANDVSWDSSADNVYLTRTLGSRAGVIMSTTSVSATSWVANFKYKSGGGSGADGIVFMFYKNGAAYTSTNASTGGDVGFCISPGCGSGSVAGYGFKIDEFNGDKYSIIQNTAGNLLVQSGSDSRTGDNAWHDVRLSYNAGVVTAYIDSDVSPVINYTIASPSYTYSNMGISGSTGGFTNNHIIDSVEVRPYLATDPTISAPTSEESLMYSAKYTWWNDNWGFRQKISATSAGAQSNYIVAVTMDTATPISGGRMKSDCSDVRFTDIYGQLLSYYLTASPGCNNAATVFNVKINNVAVGKTTLFVYYGNPEANTLSNSSLSTTSLTPSVGSGNDGDITVTSSGSINSTNFISGRSCADGGDGVNYSVTGLTSTTATLSSTPSAGCLSTGDEVLLINLMGEISGSNPFFNTGNYETLTVSSVSTNTITFTTAKTKFYGNNNYDDTNIGTANTNQLVMLQRVPNYHNVTVNGSQTLSATAWNGTKGGVLFFRASGTVTVTGSISAVGAGYRGSVYGGVNESVSGTNGIGKGRTGSGGTSGTGNGGGGGYGSKGSAGSTTNDATGGSGGTAYGDTGLTKLFMGGSGGAAESCSSTSDDDGDIFTSCGGAGNGANGGGIVYIQANTLSVTGTITADGNSSGGSGGNGAGGSLYLFTNSATLGTTLVTSRGGTSTGTTAGTGRIVATSASISGTTSPSYNSNIVIAAIVANSEETVVQPVAYWKFNEGTGTTTSDASTNSATATLAGTTKPTWQTEDFCVSGKCLYFDGSTSNLTVAKAINYINSISMWVYPTSFGSGGALIDFGDSSHTITYNSSGAITANNFTPTYYVNGYGTTSPTLTLNNWNFIVIANHAAPFNTTSSLTIGKSATSYFQGYMDDIKFYSYLKTSAQNFSDYNTPGNPNASSVLGSNSATLNKGLVGYWKMDESSGNAADSSGDGYTLTNNGTTTFSAGKFGNAPTFNGTSKYFSTASTISNVYTIAFWAKPANTTDNFINLTGSSIYINSSSGTLAATGVSSPLIYVNGVLSSTISASSWQHITITSTSPITASQFEIGRANGSYAVNNSQIDDIRVYNRALSANEVNQLYNFAPGPQGYWRFEGNINDSSGYGNAAALNGSATYKAGKFGQALSTNGGSDYASVANTISNIQTVSFWVKPTSTTANMMDIDATHYISASSGTISATNFSTPTIYVNGVASTTLAANTWQYVTVTTATGLSGSAIKIGSANGTSLTGLIDEVQVYNYVRTPKQIISDMNAGHPNVGSPVGSPVGYWKFNEGYGTTANNSGNGGSTFNGTLTGSAVPTWSNVGKYNKAVSIAGTTGFVSIPDNNALDLTTLTVSAWVNPAAINPSVSKFILWKGNTLGQDATSPYSFVMTTGNKVIFEIGDNSGSNGVTSNLALSANTWYHLVGTVDGTSVKLYINGVLDSSVAQVRTPYNSAFNLMIGGLNGGTISSWNGLIDEVKVYNYALTPQEVALDMNRSSSEQLGALSDNTVSANQVQSANAEYCVPGDSSTCTAPLLRMDFEEGTGNPNDSSSNGNNGTFNGTGTQHYQNGKFGKVANFNGTDDYVSVTNVLSGIKAVSFWIYVTSLPSTTYIMDFDSGTHKLTANSSGTISATGFTSPTVYVNGILSANLTANAWNFVEVTTGTGFNSTNPITFGRVVSSGNKFLAGKLDQIRIYNYVRNNAQTAWDYNRGAPLIWYKFNDCQGQTINDSSGNGYTANLILGGTITSPGQCSVTDNTTAWFLGSSHAKFISSMYFDGAGTYVQVPSLPAITEISMCLWANTSSLNGFQRFIDFGNTHDSNNIILMQEGNISPPQGIITLQSYSGASAGSKISVGFFGATNNAIVVGTWTHYCATVNSSATGKIYINGHLAASGSTFALTGGVVRASNFIGRSNWTADPYYNGYLEDVRIYSYALTADQVQTVYANGAANFTPSSGSP